MKNNNTFLAIHLTKKCDLKCKYCFENSGPNMKDDFNLYDVYRLIDSAKINEIKWIALTGGDPLLYPYLEEVIKYVEKNKMALFLETNGLKVNSNFVNLLRCLSVDIQLRISLDSNNKSHHEYFRGLNTFNPAVDAIKLLSSSGFNVAVNKVYSNLDFENKFNLQEYIKFCKEIGANRFEFSSIVPFGRAEEKFVLTEEQKNIIRNELFAQKGFGENIISTDFYYLRYSQNCSRLSSSGWGFPAYPDGFSMCPLQPEIKLGNLTEMSNIIKNKTLQKLNEIRKKSFRKMTKNTIWGCTECRRFFLSYYFKEKNEK